MPIYLDHNAATTLLPEVLEAMQLGLFTSIPLNPSSTHAYGRKAKHLLTQAREKIASYCGCKPQEIFFTSGGTEGLSTLIRGALAARPNAHLITTRIEHAAIDETLKHLPCPVTYLEVDQRGAPTPSQFEALSFKEMIWVLSAVNAETGALLDIAAIASLAQQKQALLLLDGVAWLGREPLNIPPGVSAIAFSGHKIHGPRGSGFCYLRSKTPFSPLLWGGGQEFGLRSGTEDLPACLGLAKAIEILERDPPFETMRTLRDHFEKNLGAPINGEGARASNVSNLYFESIDAETLLIQLDLEGIMASQGSACSAGALEPSRVLLHMGYTKARALHSVRFSLSRLTTLAEIDVAIFAIRQHLKMPS